MRNLSSSGIPFLLGYLTSFLLGKKRGSMKKLILLSILLFLIALPLVSADDTKLLIKSTAIKDEITYKESAEFDLEIVNPLLLTEEVYIISPITDWSVSLSNTRLMVPYQQSRHVSLSLTPPSNIRAGKYISCFTFTGLKHSEVSNYYCLLVTVTEGAPASEILAIEKTAEAEVTVNEEIIDKFLYSTHLITLKNTDTKIAIGEHTVNFELLSSFFVTSTPLSNGIRSVTEGKQFYWKYSLQPGEDMQIKYTMSYFPLVFSIAVVIIALIFLVSFYVSGLKIDKQLLIPSKSTHGKKAVKVKLSIKNGTNKEIKNVHVEDYIPEPLHLIEDFGTLHPSTVKKLENKIKLIWRLPKLEPKEERVLSYAFRSKLEVLGKILLPRARLIWKKEGDKKHSASYSGILVIRGKKEERLE